MALFSSKSKSGSKSKSIFEECHFDTMGTLQGLHALALLALACMLDIRLLDVVP
jgi:hypothetical protein